MKIILTDENGDVAGVVDDADMTRITESWNQSAVQELYLHNDGRFISTCFDEGPRIRRDARVVSFSKARSMVADIYEAEIYGQNDFESGRVLIKDSDAFFLDYAESKQRDIDTAASELSRFLKTMEAEGGPTEDQFAICEAFLECKQLSKVDVKLAGGYATDATSDEAVRKMIGRINKRLRDGGFGCKLDTRGKTFTSLVRSTLNDVAAAEKLK